MDVDGGEQVPPVTPVPPRQDDGDDDPGWRPWERAVVTEAAAIAAAAAVATAPRAEDRLAEDHAPPAAHLHSQPLAVVVADPVQPRVNGSTEVEVRLKSQEVKTEASEVKPEPEEDRTEASEVKKEPADLDVEARPSANPESNGNGESTAEKVKTEEADEEAKCSKVDDVKDVKKEEDQDQVGVQDDDDDEEEEDEDEDEDEDDSESGEEEEESLILETRLRRRNVDTEKEVHKQERAVLRRLAQITKKPRADRSKEEAALLRQYPKLAAVVRRNAERRKRCEDRKLEVEDPAEVLAKKCAQLAAAIDRSRSLVVYTGAGISTAADIPDYRGPNGVWTLMDQGKEVGPCDLARATPTYTHRALFTLYKRGKLKHVVSQNCDGLHMRSGLPRAALSEIHGNMFVEICKKCKPARPFVRLFDVTERTNKNRHATMRRCYVCGTSLVDTIVHFGEKGHFKWPINWAGATRAAQKADVILCLGSSLKVLRRYGWLWCMDRPKRQRPKLFIVNLQWTPKDCHARVKVNGRCDEVMAQVMAHLGMDVPEYCADNDPLFSYATPLCAEEAHTTTRTDIISRPAAREDSNGASATNGGDGEQGEEDDLERQAAAVREDHSYLSSKEERRERARAAAEARRAAMSGAVPLSQPIDFAKISWPRDALYAPYEPWFEWISEGTTVGEDAFCCDCCDPAKKRKRRAETSSEEEDEDDEGENGEDEDGSDDDGEAEEGDSDSTKASGSNGSKLKLDLSNNSSDADNSPSNSKSSTPTRINHPGWFGKGRRGKRQRNA